MRPGKKRLSSKVGLVDLSRFAHTLTERRAATWRVRDYANRLRLIVFTMPKCACALTKEKFFEINNGAKFVPGRASHGIYDRFRQAAVRRLRAKKVQPYQTIHHVPGYRTINFQRHQDMVTCDKFHAYEKVTVVRDPIDMLVSAWRS